MGGQAMRLRLNTSGTASFRVLDLGRSERQELRNKYKEFLFSRPTRDFSHYVWRIYLSDGGYGGWWYGSDVAVAAVAAAAAAAITALGCCQTKFGRFLKMKSNTFPCILISVATDGALAMNARHVSATHFAGISCTCERACTW
jgi:hypothetical protein